MESENGHGHVHSCSTTLGNHNSCVSLVPIFNHLETEQMDQIMKTAQSVSYKKGEMIYRPGEKSEALYIVNQGKIRIYRLSESGKEQLVRILKPGDFTGELALFKEADHEAYAEAIVDSKVCIIWRSNLQKFLYDYPSISLKILSEFANRLEESEKQTARFATEKVETRLALFLAECLENESTSNEIVLPMSKRELASYLGTTPETLSRKLSDLEDRGYIRQKAHKKINILNLEGLHLI